MKKFHFKSNIIKFLLVSLTCLVPILIAYEAYQLVQASSSYKVNNVKVAVVNEDRPTQQSNRLWDVGGQLVNKLRDDKKSQVHWHFVSEREAKRELNKGDVDMALIIPTDLSINAASALTARPRVSNLKIMMAKHNNFLSVQVNQQIANDVKQHVAENVQAVYAKILLNDIKEMGNQMKIASKGSSQVNGNVLDVKSGKVSVSRNLDLLTKKMISFQDVSQNIDGQINKNSEALSNQLNENSDKFGSQINQLSSNFDNQIDTNKKNMSSQINQLSSNFDNQIDTNKKNMNSQLNQFSGNFNNQIDTNQKNVDSQLNQLSSNFDNQIDTLSNGIDTLTINNKKINVNLADLQENSSGVGNSLTDLSGSTSSANKSINDYTTQFGNLNNQLGVLNKQTKQLNDDSQTDLTTVNNTIDFVKNSSELIDNVVMLKAIDVSDLAKMKDSQATDDTLKDKAQDILTKNEQIDNNNQKINSNDQSALDNLAKFDQDNTIDAEVKNNINSNYITPAKASLNENIELSQTQKENTTAIKDDATSIKGSIETLSEQIATINKLIPIVQDIDKSPLASSESQEDVKLIMASLPNVVKTLKSVPGIDESANKSATDSDNLAKNSDDISNNINSLDSIVKNLNDNYGELSNGIKSARGSSDGVVNEGQDLISSSSKFKDSKAQLVNSAIQSSSKNSQGLGSELQNGLNDLNTSLDNYNTLDSSKNGLNDLNTSLDNYNTLDSSKNGLNDLNTSLDNYKTFNPSNMNESMTDQVAQAEKKNNDQLANVADAARDTSDKASDNDDKIHDSLADLVNNNKRLHNFLTDNAKKVVPINTQQKNIDSFVNPVNNDVLGKTFGSTLNKLFAPTIIAVVLYVGALLTYMLKIYGRKHKELDISNITVGVISILQSIGAILVSIYFHVSPSNIVLLIMISTVVALSFNGISLAMNKLMGILGFIIMILLLVVQVIISNNVIPASALGVFSKVALLLPLTYGVKAFNDVINSFLYTPTLTIDMIILIIYPIILFVINFAIKKYHERKMLEKD